jgi:hypothetical protein
VQAAIGGSATGVRRRLEPLHAGPFYLTQFVTRYLHKKEMLNSTAEIQPNPGGFDDIARPHCGIR